MIKIAPSLLSADFSQLGNEIKLLEQAKADYLHLDVMDGSFVPNLTFGNEVIKSLRKITNLPFDAHLMINNPQNHISAFVDAGCDIITIHAESCLHIDRTLALIKSYHKKAGLSLVPSTPENMVQYLLDKLDLILVMTVNPGFGGQKFLASQLQKISNLQQLIKNSGKNIELQVDGGINLATAPLVARAGADVLVAGSYVFSSDNYAGNIANLRQACLV
ncbi:MAG: ribulose-phosphate 3-epimerase [Proteobacteria bacterium]|jgi:ribulose-phosphate 3-epimerase|nr:ribulose-phosphate 3-epimerase [Pseudomonadota bacterium]